MTKTKHIFTKIINLILVAMLIVFAFLPLSAEAAQLTVRSLTLGSSLASASTPYTIAFTTGSTATIQSFEAKVCTTASGTCTTPGGFSVTGSTFTSSTLVGTWTVSTATAGSLRASATGASSTSTGTAKNMIFGSVTNPSATNSSFYVRITTFSDASWATPVDTGTVASSTAGQITVTASVDEALSFTLTSATVALGTLTTATTGTGTSTMSASTNASSGYNITVNGTTLTSGANTITALASQTASTQNSSQFGINLKANTTPSIGSNVSGGGSGVASTNYNTADQFRFVTGDTVATATAATNSNTFTVSYIANIAGITPPGNYSTVLTYIATANF